MSTAVLIIGAGLAGLAAAKELSDHGVEVRIIEARERLGGRLHTIDDDYDFPIELGAEFVHGKAPEIWNVINKERITVYDTTDKHWWRRGDKLMASSQSFFAQLEEIFDGMGATVAGQDISFNQYLDKHCQSAPEEAKSIAKRYVQGFDAADIDQASTQALARENELARQIGDQSFRLLDGYDALVGHFGGRLDSQQLVLNTPIKAIQWQQGQVSALSEDETGTLLTFSASRAIIALPLGVLQANADQPGGVSFRPEVPQLRQCLDFLRMGKVVKVILRFGERFWEKLALDGEGGGKQSLWDLGFIHSDHEHFPTWWTMLPLRVPLIVGWSAGAAAEALADKDRQFIRQAALDSLSELIDCQPGELERQLESFHFHDWTNDPYSRGAYSYVAVGGADVPQRLMEPIADTLFFAGEHTAAEGYAATVHGAIASGQRAARQVLESLRNG